VIEGNDLSDLHSSLFQAIDGLWFLAVEDEYGLDAALKLDVKVWERYGKLEARRIAKLVGVELGKASLGELIKTFKLTPVATYFRSNFKESGGEVVIKLTRCPPQEARIRGGRGVFPCKPVGIAYFTNFAGELNPLFKTNCLWCPPDPRNAEAWCAWRFKL